jgi:hypothetical protein
MSALLEFIFKVHGHSSGMEWNRKKHNSFGKFTLVLDNWNIQKNPSSKTSTHEFKTPGGTT